MARMDVPGRWAGGFRAWDDNGIYLATGRGATPGRVLRLDAPRLRELVNHWFPLAGHLIGRASPHGPVDRVHGAGSATPWSRSARSRRVSRTRSTTRPPPRAARSTTSASAATRCSRRSPGSPATTSRRAQFTALDALRREAGRPSDRWTRWRWRTVRASWPTWLESHGVADPWGLASALAAGGIDRAWCERVHEALGDEALGPGPGVGLGHDLVQEPAHRAEGRRTPDLRAGRGRALLLPARPRVAAARRRPRGAGEHAHHARPQAARRRHRASGSTTSCRRSTRSPASSTRSGPTWSTTRSTRWTGRGP